MTSAAGDKLNTTSDSKTPNLTTPNGPSSRSRLVAGVRAAAGPLVVVAFLVVALWFLHQELREIHYRQVAAEIHGKSWGTRIAAILLMVASYLCLTAYDFLGFRYLGRSIPRGPLALSSFISYAFSQTLGFATITGMAIRFRLYSAWGLTAGEVARIYGFCSVTFWLGFLLLAGITFSLFPIPIPTESALHWLPPRALGVALLLLLITYLLWTRYAKHPLRVRHLQFDPPKTALSIVGVGVSSLDWGLACATLYMLLPTNLVMGFPELLGIYMLANVLGLLSHVPGGLGVFEATIILAVGAAAPKTELVASLVLYRLTYYLLPFCIAMVLLALVEISRHQKTLARVMATRHWLAPVIPTFFAATTLMAGALLLFSGATPAAHGRISWLASILPLPVIEMSHFLGSVIGACLLILARGIQRRLSVAFHLFVLLLTCGIAVSLLKGADYEEAIALSIMLISVLPCRHQFHRRAALVEQRFTPGWTIAVLTIVAASLWLAIFDYKHAPYSNDLWWHFSPNADVSRSMRGAAGSIVVLLLFSIARLVRPAGRPPSLPNETELATAESILQHADEPSAWLAMTGDKHLLFSPKSDAFIMFGVSGRSWVSMGGPVGARASHSELIWRFHEFADRFGGRTVFYEVSPEHLHHFVELGLTAVKLGEEATVPLSTFSLEGGARKELRQVSNRLTKSGVAFEIIEAQRVDAILERLRQISNEWLSSKKVREKRFSVGRFDETYLMRCPVAVVKVDERIVAFANIWTTTGKNELSIDLMRYSHDAPHGTMDFLFVRLMIWGREQGYAAFNLGMAPLAGLETHPMRTTWNRFGNALFRHAEHFYNFQGLRTYKAKFEPEWTPKYLVLPNRFAFPSVLLDIGSLISGGLRGAVGR